MNQVTEVVEQYELWLYGGLGLAALWYVRTLWRAQHRLWISVFGLERETASLARARALSMLFVVGAVAVLIYLSTKHITPNLSLFSPVEAAPALVMLTAESTPTPDVVILLPGQRTPTLVGTPTPLPVNTPVPAAGVGCDNPGATITSPLPGAVLSGVVEVQGVASIPNFAFYVLEISTVGDNWLNVYAGNNPVEGGVLGQWNADLHPLSNYAFRLVVYDASGAFAEPCTIPITIGAAP